MITGEIKNQIDAIWDTYWVGGITNPMSVLEQMTYLFFMKMIDDAQRKKKVEYESTEVIQGRIEAVESEITAAIQEFRTKFM